MTNTNNTQQPEVRIDVTMPGTLLTLRRGFVMQCLATADRNCWTDTIDAIRQLFTEVFDGKTHIMPMAEYEKMKKQAEAPAFYVLPEGGFAKLGEPAPQHSVTDGPVEAATDETSTDYIVQRLITGGAGHLTQKDAAALIRGLEQTVADQADKLLAADARITALSAMMNTQGRNAVELVAEKAKVTRERDNWRLEAELQTKSRNVWRDKFTALNAGIKSLLNSNS